MTRRLPPAERNLPPGGSRLRRLLPALTVCLTLLCPLALPSRVPDIGYGLISTIQLLQPTYLTTGLEQDAPCERA
jgi:hypothetical protein